MTGVGRLAVWSTASAVLRASSRCAAVTDRAHGGGIWTESHFGPGCLFISFASWMPLMPPPPPRMLLRILERSIPKGSLPVAPCVSFVVPVGSFVGGLIVGVVPGGLIVGGVVLASSVKAP